MEQLAGAGKLPSAARHALGALTLHCRGSAVAQVCACRTRCRASTAAPSLCAGAGESQAGSQGGRSGRAPARPGSIASTYWRDERSDRKNLLTVIDERCAYLLAGCWLVCSAWLVCMSVCHVAPASTDRHAAAIPSARCKWCAPCLCCSLLCHARASPGNSGVNLERHVHVCSLRLITASHIDMCTPLQV